jgi:hypothetical protein
MAQIFPELLTRLDTDYESGAAAKLAAKANSKVGDGNAGWRRRPDEVDALRADHAVAAVRALSRHNIGLAV